MAIPVHKILMLLEYFLILAANYILGFSSLIVLSHLSSTKGKQLESISAFYTSKFMSTPFNPASMPISRKAKRYSLPQRSIASWEQLSSMLYTCSFNTRSNINNQTNSTLKKMPTKTFKIHHL